MLYITQIFFLLFFFISIFWNLKICSYLFLLFFPLLFSALHVFHPSILFYFFSASCSVFSSLTVFFSNLLSFLFSLSLFLLLYSVCFSLMFYHCSICSLSVEVPYLILLCYLFCSCFCFPYTPSFWQGSNDTSCSVFVSFSLFSFPLFSFCSFYASFLPFSLCSCILFFFCCLLSSLLYATPVLTVNFLGAFDALFFSWMVLFQFPHM